MLILVWAVICERVVTDRQTGMVSHLTCLDGITARGVPVAIPFIGLGSLWRTDNPGDTFQFRVFIKAPDSSEREIVCSDNIQFPVKAKRYRANVVMNGLELAQYGTYLFRIEGRQNGEWQSFAEIPLDIDPPTENARSGRQQ